ncbi:hypothetical protein [Pseudoxanthobacter sp.]|uniref:hypothetical protein n=1 Tax=Pseudoxanthobacter sp. TaxID=1925742 RepID=UPI002FE27E70
MRPARLPRPAARRRLLPRRLAAVVLAGLTGAVAVTGLAGSGLLGTTALAQAAGAQFVAPKPETCESIATRLRRSVHLAFTTAEIAFTDPINGWKGRACRIAATGRGLPYRTLESALKAIEAPFADWTVDKSRSTVGPTGELKSFKNGDLIAVVSAEWNPPPGVCSAEQALAACKVAPAKRIWSVSVDLVQRAPKAD